MRILFGKEIDINFFPLFKLQGKKKVLGFSKKKRVKLKKNNTLKTPLFRGFLQATQFLILTQLSKRRGFNKHKCSESFLFLVGRAKLLIDLSFLTTSVPRFRYSVNVFFTNVFIILRNLLSKTMKRNTSVFCNNGRP